MVENEGTFLWRGLPGGRCDQGPEDTVQADVRAFCLLTFLLVAQAEQGRCAATEPALGCFTHWGGMADRKPRRHSLHRLSRLNRKSQKKSNTGTYNTSHTCPSGKSLASQAKPDNHVPPEIQSPFWTTTSPPAPVSSLRCHRQNAHQAQLRQIRL